MPFTPQALRPLLAVVIAVLAGLASCGGGGAGGTAALDPPGSTAPTGVARPTHDEAAMSGTLLVFAAASLTDAFTEIGDVFAAEHPDVELEFNFAASSTLVTQIREGAPAGVYASADLATMARLTDGPGTVGEPEVFATNRLQIIVEAGNPLGIGEVADLARPGVLLVAAAPEVPIGRYTQEVLDRAGVTVTARSLEENVRAVVSKVVLGEADAGIVYRSDVLSLGDRAEGVDIADDLDVVARYPIAIPAEAPTPELAAAFVDLVLGDGGQRILRDHGFEAP